MTDEKQNSPNIQKLIIDSPYAIPLAIGISCAALGFILALLIFPPDDTSETMNEDVASIEGKAQATPIQSEVEPNSPAPNDVTEEESTTIAAASSNVLPLVTDLDAPSRVAQAATTSPASNAIYEGPIIDAHAHALYIDYFEEIGWPIDPWKKKPTPRYTPQTLMETTFAAMEKYNVVKAVVSGKIEDVDRWREYNPERVVPGIILGGPYDVPVSQLLKYYEEGRIATLGEVFTQYYGLGFDDPTVASYYALAEELDIPLGIHTGLSNADEIEDGGYRDFRVRLGNPLDMEEVFARHKGTRIVLQHAGAPFIQETTGILGIYPNVYIDLASVLYALPEAGVHHILKQFVVYQNLGKRVMFGSDVYLWPDSQYRVSIDAINSADFLTYEQKADIFCGNAARFFKLDMSLCEIESE